MTSLSSTAAPHLPPGLHEVFASQSILGSFHDFAATQFCEENVLFLEEVLEMKRQRKSAFIENIYTKYIREDSPLQVNIDATLQTAIAEKFKDRRSMSSSQEFGMFDDAFTHVAEMIERDTLRKFRETEGGSALRSGSPHFTSALEVANAPTWFRGHLLRKKGFFGQWKPFTYMKKGSYFFEYKPGANHVKSEPLVAINLSGALIETAKMLTGRDFTFIVHAKDGKSYFLQASSKDDMQEWMEELSLQRLRGKEQPPKEHHDSDSVHSGSSANSSQKSDPSMTPEEALKTLPIFGYLESFVDAVIASDSAGLIIAFNSAAERMFGYTKEEVQGQPLKILMPEPFRSMHDGYMFRHEKFGDEKLIGKPRGLPAMRKNGEVFKMQISLGKLPVKGFFIATLREVKPENPEDDQ